jgi:predicted phosphohydrolase
MNLLQVCSDVHLEMGDINETQFADIIQSSAEILILAGDIGDPTELIFDKFIGYCASIFKHVLFVSGNHEYYYKTIEEADECIEQIINRYSNVIYLNNKTFEYEGIVFVGTTLWSLLPENETTYKLFSVNDFKKIKNYSIKKNNLLFEKNLEFLQNNFCKKCIIITHHAPSYRCISEKYQGNVLNCCFANHLDHLFTDENVIGWIYGHTHHNYKFYNNKFFLYSNCYRGDNYEINGCPL